MPHFPSPSLCQPKARTHYSTAKLFVKMQQRKSTNEGQQTTILRRSPRNLQTDPEDPKTPEPIPRRNRVPLSGRLRLSSTRKVSSKKTYKHYPEASEEVSKSNNGSNNFMKPNVGSRRSARLNSRVEGFSGKENTDECVERICLDKSKHIFLSDASEAKVSINSHKQFLDTLGKRAKRTSSRPNANGNTEKCLGFTQGASTELSDDGVLSGEGKAKIAVNSSTQCVKLGKRMTRSSSKRDTNINAEKTCNGKCSNRFNVCVSTDSLDKGVLSDEGRAQVGGNLSENPVAKMEKRMTRSSYKRNINKYVDKSSDGKRKEFIQCTMTGCSNEGVSLEQFEGNSGKRTVCSSVAYSMEKMGGTERKETQIDNGTKWNGVKRKRNQFDKGHGIVQGWTKEQELALQRAYFTAKPTPHFWKKVSRLVPGKSAQDCFNKIHSDNLTPPPHQPRSRTNKANSSPLSLSPSKLLDCMKPKTRKTSYRKRKSHLLQKTVRELLQKQNRVNQDYEADLFSVLEPTLNPSTQVFQQGMVHSTSAHNLEKPGFLKKCQEKSSSAHKKHMSQSSSLHGETLASPPVLKQVKNKALHEKYIDQLHCREAKRKAALARIAKSSRGKEDTKESYIQKMDAIKAAKTVLVFDAMDVINQFRHVEVNAKSDFSDVDDVTGDSNEDEGEY